MTNKIFAPKQNVQILLTTGWQEAWYIKPLRSSETYNTCNHLVLWLQWNEVCCVKDEEIRSSGEQV